MTDEAPKFPFGRLEGFTFQFKRKNFVLVFNELSLARHASKRDGDVCWYCGTKFHKIARSALHRSLEHFIPRQCVGANLPETTCVAHGYCNNLAGSRSLEYRYALRVRLRAEVAKNPNYIIEKGVAQSAKVLKSREQKLLKTRNQWDREHAARQYDYARNLHGAHSAVLRAHTRQTPLEAQATPLSGPAPSSEHPAPIHCKD